MARLIRTSVVAATPALAARPVTLSDHQLDSVAAGSFPASFFSRLAAWRALVNPQSSGDKSGGRPLGVSSLDLGSTRLREFLKINGVSTLDLGSSR
jgi:hypothetical protein